mgnify:FL=1
MFNYNVYQSPIYLIYASNVDKNSSSEKYNTIFITILYYFEEKILHLMGEFIIISGSSHILEILNTFIQLYKLYYVLINPVRIICPK